MKPIVHGSAEYRCECGRRYSSTFIVQPLEGPGLDTDDTTVRCNARKDGQTGRACWKDHGHDGPHSWELT